MPTYSHSRLSTYENCPLQYKYRYIEEIDLGDEEGVEAFLGSRVHDVLEKLYRDLMHGKPNTSEDLEEYYLDLWNKSWHEDIVIVKKRFTDDNYKETGRKCVSDYYNRYYPFEQSKTLGLEEMISIEIEGYRLRGFMDRLSHKKEGRYEIHDYKTAQYLPKQQKFDSDRQLALYQIGVEEMWGDADEVDLIWHYLVHDKEIRSNRTAEQVANLKSDIVSLIQEMEGAEDEDSFPAVESGLCGWCGYQELCPNHSHIIRTKKLPENEFLNETGVGLVDRYVALDSEKKEYNKLSDEKLLKIKEALIGYAAKEGVEAVGGTSHKAKVKPYTRKKLPGKSDSNREKLDQLIRDSGKWLDVSDLNTNTLIKKLDGLKLDETTMKELKKHLTEETEYRVSFSKKK